MDAWDGTERRIGDGDRRKGQRVPFAEYPKMVDGQIVHAAPETSATASQPSKPSRKSGRKK